MLTFTIFAVINLLLGPIAFLKALLHKFLILKRVQSRKAFTDLTYFWLFGPYLLAMGQAFDLVHFTIHMYTWQ
jgi:hypothetical protein